MRVIVHGVGAIGGTVAAGLALAGTEVVGVARGAQLRTIRRNGLALRRAEDTLTARFDCVETPEDIPLRDDDAILLAMKTQDTPAALQALRAAGVERQPVWCMQNGVANEPMAARLFPNVHAITVIMPATFITPGEIGVHGAPKMGIFEVGRFPGGHDAADDALCHVLNAADIAAFPEDRVMAGKYGKLLMNLLNVVNAALEPGLKAGDLGTAIQDEGRNVYAAAGIDWRDVSGNDPRRERFMRFHDVPGLAYGGTSTSQSLARGTGQVETDWLNGEISMLGRTVGVTTPLNDRLTRLGDFLARGAIAPRSMTVEDVAAFLGVKGRS